MELGNYQAAEENFLSALHMSEMIGSKSGISLAYGNLGKVSLFLKEYQNARTLLKKGLSVAKSIENKRDIEFNYQWLYALDSAEGKYRQAFEHYKFYKLYQDSLYGDETGNKMEQLKFQYETEKKDKEIELLNKDNEIKALQLSRQKAIRHGMIAGIVLLFITGFFLFRSFRLRKKLEQQQAIISERKRISADLHDDVGSGLSRIMLLTELVKDEARTPETRKEAEKIAAISRELSANISEIIWALNANNDNMESLLAYIRRYAAEFFENSAVILRIDTPGEITRTPISGELRRDIFYTVKEALHNTFKHSQASEAILSFSVENEFLTIVIHDNGIGMPEKETGRYGNGLTNMQQRMESVGGSISIENHQGTKITLTVPI
jgi:signal transduction histidine kinase